MKTSFKDPSLPLLSFCVSLSTQFVSIPALGHQFLPSHFCNSTLIFRHEIRSGTPPHLLLKPAGQISEREEQSTRAKVDERVTTLRQLHIANLMQKWNGFRDRDWAHRPLSGQPEAHVSHFAEETTPPAFWTRILNRIWSQQPQEIETTDQPTKQPLMLRLDGKPQTEAEVRSHRDSLEKLLDYMAVLHLRGRSGGDMDKEVTERFLRYFLSAGINLAVTRDEKGDLLVQIRTDGSHPLNRTAQRLHRTHNGLKLFAKEKTQQRATYYNFQNHLVLDFDEIFHFDLKSATKLHELRHVANWLHRRERDLGMSAAAPGSVLPAYQGNGGGYTQKQSHEEAEAYLVSIRVQAGEKLLRKILNDGLRLPHSNRVHPRNTLAFDEIELFEMIQMLLNVLAQNGMVTSQMGGLTEIGSIEESRLVSSRREFDGQMVYFYLFDIHHRGHPFYYFLPIDPRARFHSDLRGYINSKISHLRKLNLNQYAQVLAIHRAVDLYFQLEAHREKAAVLAGIAALTRPHFWDFDRLKPVTVDELIHKFNIVVSDRWFRWQTWNSH